MSTDDKHLKKLLEHYRYTASLGPNLIYRYGWDFILQHGKSYKIVPIPKGVKQGARKQCFGNAIVLAVFNGWKYIEGYAMTSQVSIPIQHAWNETPSGELVDNTWMNQGAAYLGVEFSVERADDATWNGDGSILNDYRRRYPLFQKPWTGEDFSIQWPHSKRLELMRAGKYVEVMELMERELDEDEVSGGPVADLSRHD